MSETADAGCHLCRFLLQAILRREFPFQGEIQVVAGYIWGHDRGLVASRDDGLVLWRCQVYEADDADRFLGAVNFNIETRNGKYFGLLCKLGKLIMLLDEILTWLRLDETRCSEPLDPNNVEWFKDELNRCEDQCNHVRAYTEFLPTRLIDVGSKAGDGVQLIITADLLAEQKKDKDHRIKYATLSYCWGPKEDAAEQVKTTIGNYSKHTRGMSLDSMSPVVRDTIVVCRALDIQYLWVDALCIIQGDFDDWDRESQMMGQVYYCSHLTICPLSSRSCLEGFLGPRPRGLDIEFQSSRLERLRGTYTLFECQKVDGPNTKTTLAPPCKYIDMDYSSWATRGWTFQEEALSLRMLFFGASMSHFCCESESISENSYWTAGTEVHCGARYFMNSTLAPADLHPSWERIRPYEEWAAMKEIQNRQWTYMEDILPGISGLAKECALLTDDVYLAGLWKKNLQHDLNWERLNPEPGNLDQTLQRIRNQSPYIAPSWSWVSQRKWFEGLTSWQYPYEPDENYIYVKEKERKREREEEREEPGTKSFMLANCLPCHAWEEFTVEDIHMDLWGKNPYGRLKGGFIKVLGKVAPFPSQVMMEPRSPRKTRPAFGYFMNNLGTCQLDWSSETSTIQEPERMRLLLVSSCCAATSNWGRLLWGANPKEDHEKLHRDFMKSNLCHILGDDYVASENCECCQNSGIARNAWGIVIHPAEESDSFYRVGVFVLFAYSGGTDLFKNVASQTIKLI
ncbi:hypothetical protein CDV31_007654 [Fusarium ambrosium]|uniref:Heterokaryon incompatibility domain-containing protein n=1 Tax=Fusarium ambrosium TaxID=131363 RepID=A0A428U5R7_9HYPO|nr:hypothetical protein CDV31_007654 [Fusarium ambrosium]